MDKVKIGIVGMGFIADWHYKGFLNNKNAEIVGMTQDFYGDEIKTSQMREQLRNKCSEWKIKCYKDFNSMVSDPEIDALIIGSINPYHFDQIKKGIDNKKHLLIEKPVVTDIQQYAEIKKMMSGTNVKIFPAHNFVYRDAVVKAKEIINNGKLGKIIRGSFVSTHTISKAHETGWRSKKNLSSGGALMDSGHHVVYQSIYFMGMPVKLQSFVSKLILTGMDNEDTAQVNLVYPDDSMSVIMQSWGSNYGTMSNGIKIFGDNGEVAITDALYFNGEKIDVRTDYENSFINQATAFTDYILKDKKPLSTIDDAENTLKIIHAAYKSDAEEKLIKL